MGVALVEGVIEVVGVGDTLGDDVMEVVDVFELVGVID